MNAETNLILYLLTGATLYVLFACYVGYYYYSLFAKNSIRYPDKKNLKELLKISNPLVVSYHIATEKKEI